MKPRGGGPQGGTTIYINKFQCVTKLFPTQFYCLLADIVFVNILASHANKYQYSLKLHSAKCSLLLWRNRPSSNLGLDQENQMLPDSFLI